MSIYFPENIQSIPLAIPIIIPDDFKLFNEVLISNRRFIKKTKLNHNLTGGKWIGMDIYRDDKFDEESIPYTANYVDCRKYFPNMFKTIFEFIPLDIVCIRLVTSTCSFIPHKDYNHPELSTRTIIVDNNKSPTFFYVKDGKKIYQKLPLETNTWMYNDGNLMHGSDHYPGKSKIMLMYYGKPNNEKLRQILDLSQTQYKDYIIA